MANEKEDLNFSISTKKLRFRGDVNFHNHIEEILDDDNKNKNNKENSNKSENDAEAEAPSFMDFFKVEMTRGYMLEHDEERYTARRQKIYSFMRIPRDLERFIVYGIMQCADSFLYIHTFLPVRFALALWGLITRLLARCLGLRRRTQRLLTPAEICDLLKASIWIACTFLMLSVDTNRVYHIIKSQSIIKLYIFYNMLEVGDRLLSAFGQDTIDALFWTATEPKKSKREHIGLMTHVLLALIYVMLHSFLIMFQATALNVAVNSNNKALLTIMMSNNFVELKGSVFKKFDKNNLFQLTCSDVRERFHLSVLMFIVMIQTMKEFDWSLTQFCVMLPDCFAVLITEILIDWIKHAFITRFNEIPEGIYREYTTSLAYDMTQTRQKHAFSDHSDLVARRMGFIPFPLSVVLIKAVYSAVAFHNAAALVLFLLSYVFVLGLRICITICALGKACKLMKEHQDEKSQSANNSMTNVAPLNTSAVHNNGPSGGLAPSVNSTSTVTPTATPTSTIRHSNSVKTPEPINSFAATFALNGGFSTPKQHTKVPVQKSSSTSNAANCSSTYIDAGAMNSLELGATVIFSNSDVDLNDVRLNEQLLVSPSTTAAPDFVELARSQPDLSIPLRSDNDSDDNAKIEEKAASHNLPTGNNNGDASKSLDATRQRHIPQRTHRRSESEPGMQNIIVDNDIST